MNAKAALAKTTGRKKTSAEVAPRLMTHKTLSQPPTKPIANIQGVIFDDQARYREQIREKITQHKFYPARARRMRRQGTVVVAFTIQADGHFTDLKIKRQSGTPALDRAALSSIKKIKRFPAFPDNISRKQWSFEIPINYTLKKP